MSTNIPFNVTIFTDETKKICTCTAVAIFIIFLFEISPLTYMTKISLFMRIIALFILGYIIYLNVNQMKLLQSASLSYSDSDQIKSQLNMNLIGSCIFTGFIVLLLIFIIKRFL
jgi:hypothetical protein